MRVTRERETIRLNSRLLHSRRHGPRPSRHAPTPPGLVEHLHARHGGRRGPGGKGKSAKGHVGLGRVADVAAAEEQAAQKGGQGGEAGKVEEGVCQVEGGGDVGFGDCLGVVLVGRWSQEMG